MQLRKKGNLSPRRLATDGILIACFFLLSLVSVEVGGIKIALASLPVVICAMLYGPVDGFIVGLLGAFLEQMLRYGFTATTALWILPPAIRGLLIGLSVVLFSSALSLDAVLSRKRPWAYFAACIVAALVVSCLNTAVYYVDAKLYGYYNYALIFGVFGLRLLTGVLSSLVTSVVALPVLAALRRLHLSPERNRV